MPKRYEEIKKSLMERGYSETAAKTSAARIYQKTRKSNEPELNAAVARENKRKQRG